LEYSDVVIVFHDAHRDGTGELVTNWEEKVAQFTNKGGTVTVHSPDLQQCRESCAVVAAVTFAAVTREMEKGVHVTQAKAPDAANPTHVRAFQSHEQQWGPAVGERVEAYFFRNTVGGTPPRDLEGRVGVVKRVDTRFRTVTVKFEKDESGPAAVHSFEDFWLIPADSGEPTIDHFRDEEDVEEALQFFKPHKHTETPAAVPWDVFNTIAENLASDYRRGLDVPSRTLVVTTNHSTVDHNLQCGHWALAIIAFKDRGTGSDSAFSDSTSVPSDSAPNALYQASGGHASAAPLENACSSSGGVGAVGRGAAPGGPTAGRSVALQQRSTRTASGASDEVEGQAQGGAEGGSPTSGLPPAVRTTEGGHGHPESSVKLSGQTSIEAPVVGQQPRAAEDEGSTGDGDDEALCSNSETPTRSPYLSGGPSTHGSTGDTTEDTDSSPVVDDFADGDCMRRALEKAGIVSPTRFVSPASVRKLYQQLRQEQQRTKEGMPAAASVEDLQHDTGRSSAVLDSAFAAVSDEGEVAEGGSASLAAMVVVAAHEGGGVSKRGEATGKGDTVEAQASESAPLKVFFAATTFDGPKDGFTFKFGGEGVGYYPEVFVLQTEVAAVVPTGGVKSHAAVVVEVESEAQAKDAAGAKSILCGALPADHVGTAASARDVSMTAEDTTEGAASTEPPTARFVAAASFDGPKRGYVFKGGAEGTGYYLEKPSLGEAEDHALAVSVSLLSAETEDQKRAKALRAAKARVQGQTAARKRASTEVRSQAGTGGVALAEQSSLLVQGLIHGQEGKELEEIEETDIDDDSDSSVCGQQPETRAGYELVAEGGQSLRRSARPRRQTAKCPAAPTDQCPQGI